MSRGAERSAEIIPIEPDADNADAGKYDITKRIMTLEYCKISIRRCIRKEAPILWLNDHGLGAFSVIKTRT